MPTMVGGGDVCGAGVLLVGAGLLLVVFEALSFSTELEVMVVCVGVVMVVLVVKEELLAFEILTFGTELLVVNDEVAKLVVCPPCSSTEGVVISNSFSDEVVKSFSEEAVKTSSS